MTDIMYVTSLLLDLIYCVSRTLCVTVLIHESEGPKLNDFIETHIFMCLSLRKHTLVSGSVLSF